METGAPTARLDESHAIAEMCRSQSDRGSPDPRSRLLRRPDPATASRLDSSTPSEARLDGRHQRCPAAQTRQSYIRRKSREWETLKFSHFPLRYLRNGCGRSPRFSRASADNRDVSPDISIGYDRRHRSEFGKTAWGGEPVHSYRDRPARVGHSYRYYVLALAGCGDSPPDCRPARPAPASSAARQASGSRGSAIDVHHQRHLRLVERRRERDERRQPRSSVPRSR